MLNQKQGTCPEDGKVLVQKEKVNHILHFLMCIPTFGTWALVWVFLIANDATKPYMCTKCGQSMKLLLK